MSPQSSEKESPYGEDAPHLGVVAAAAALALVLVVGVGPGSAATTSYQTSDGTVLNITTLDNVSVTKGSWAHFPVTVSVNGPSTATVRFASEKLYNTRTQGADDRNPNDGLRKHASSVGSVVNVFASIGESCTTQLKLAPNFVGTRTEKYMAAASCLASANT